MFLFFLLSVCWLGQPPAASELTTTRYPLIFSLHAGAYKYYRLYAESFNGRNMKVSEWALFQSACVLPCEANSQLQRANILQEYIFAL